MSGIVGYDYVDRSEAFRKYLEENLPKVNLEEKPMKFKVTIEEHISQAFEVEASSMEEAMQIAEQKYSDGEFVVDNCNAPTAQLMMAEDEVTGECTEWEEF